LSASMMLMTSFGAGGKFELLHGVIAARHRVLLWEGRHVCT
jgi:hypothetical protein